jgi:hypothetical protein
VRDHIRLKRDGTLVRRDGHFAGKSITSARFMCVIDGVQFQFETSKVKTFLRTGNWSRRPNRRNPSGQNGPRTAADRRRADDKLLRLMARRPKATVCELAEAFKVTHPVLSRRIHRLKEMGLVSHGPAGWEVELLAAPKCTPWLRPLADYNVRTETSMCDGRRYS